MLSMYDSRELDCVLYLRGHLCEQTPRSASLSTSPIEAIEDTTLVCAQLLQQEASLLLMDAASRVGVTELVGAIIAEPLSGSASHLTWEQTGQVTLDKALTELDARREKMEVHGSYSEEFMLLLQVRCGVVWCGVVWCGVVWCGVVWSISCLLSMLPPLTHITPNPSLSRLYAYILIHPIFTYPIFDRSQAF
jgi:hypothetical protein